MLLDKPPSDPAQNKPEPDSRPSIPIAGILSINESIDPQAISNQNKKQTIALRARAFASLALAEKGARSTPAHHVNMHMIQTEKPGQPLPAFVKTKKVGPFLIQWRVSRKSLMSFKASISYLEASAAPLARVQLH